MLRCGVCSEPIRHHEGKYVHTHGDDPCCHTGDGATALPPLNYCPDSSLLNFGAAMLKGGSADD